MDQKVVVVVLGILVSFWSRFGVIFEVISGRFGVVFELFLWSFWGRFWIVFRSFWDRFWVVLGSFWGCFGSFRSCLGLGVYTWKEREKTCFLAFLVFVWIVFVSFCGAFRSFLAASWLFCVIFGSCWSF